MRLVVFGWLVRLGLRIEAAGFALYRWALAHRTLGR
jgi:hypothetical protein